MRFCSIVCAASVGTCMQIFVSVFIITLVSFLWSRRHHPTVSRPEITNLLRPVPPEMSSSPRLPGQPSQEKVIEEEYPIARLPYNEDTIVTLVGDIYRIFVQLGYMNNRADGEKELVWPPPEGHSINEAICKELNLSPKVISLMRRLPYPVSYHIAADLPFKPWSTAFAYTEDRQIRDGRDPGRWIFDEPRTDFLLPHEIALAGADDEGIHLILDTQEKHEYLLTNLDIIRAPDWEELELEDEHGNSLFRSLPSHHAPTFLAEYVNKLRSLEIIPGGQESYGCFYDEHGGKMYPIIKKVLQEQYGWPYDFRETEWKAAARDTLKRLEQLYP